MTNLTALTDRYLKTYFAFYPHSATQNGYAGYDDRLPDYSPQNISRQVTALQEIIDQANILKPDNFNDEIDLDLLIRSCGLNLFWLKNMRPFENNPAETIGTASSSLWTLMMNPCLEPAQKAKSIGARLNALPDFFQRATDNAKAPKKLWVRLGGEEAQGFFSYSKNTILPFLLDQQMTEAPALIEQAQKAAEAFVAAMNQRDDQNSDFAVGRMPFELLLKTFHGMDMTPETIRDIGFVQIKKIKGELEEQAKKIDPSKKWEELIEELKNHHPEEEKLVEAYQSKVRELKAFLIKNKIVSLPADESLEIIETPPFLRNSIPYAAYSSPAMFGPNNRGLFYVSPVSGRKEVLREHCDASYPLTALHEAYPGHHLQFSIQRQLPSGMRKTYNVASYYEGWTLYCEEMMFREGFYDEGMRLFQLKDRLWRAARIVVDVSMQCFGMSDEEAAKFLVDEAKLSPASARVDVNWYTQSPTTPLSYLIGMLEVDRMREEFMKKGKTLKEFHDAFLSCGAIPLNHVRRIILS